MKIQEAIKLRDSYGGHITLDELVEIIKGDKIYMCPQCYGTGYNFKTISSQPCDCGLCGGDGYTKEEYVPRMVQDGWTVRR